MKKKFRPDLINTGVLILFLLVIGFLLLSIFAPFSRKVKTVTANAINSQLTSDTIADPMQLPVPDDTSTMTYGEFRMLQTKQEQWKHNRETINRGTFGNSANFALLGFSAIRECDTCTTFSFEGPAKYYLMLPGYKMEGRFNKYYVDKGRYWLKYVVWDKPNEGHYEQKELPFRFSFSDEGFSFYAIKGNVLIPVSKKTYDLIYWPIIVISIIILIGLLYVYFAIPARILLHISRGEIFTPKHVRQLYLVAGCMLGLPVLIILFQWLLKLAFHEYITADVQLATISTFFDYKYLLMAGLVFLAIAKAFNKGLLLQHEQDLTV
ncbi:DUF2975 domain-containing protein [Chitinophaga sp. 22321]|uniref:DUF2975 domain-containing protein n=1 Tax=Chitinophaga hostae TaxID=2831022 RepID=A0ABS5J0M6_9BACT|nr:DUF2975 domain-containing protein [Chitinophaga hostae]MBS0028766.1 DUF2975 domain-containing protein [Chitinophaga hostae]